MTGRPERRERRLLGVCVVVPVVEAVVLVATGLRSATPLAPQVVAVPPLGLFHDLRWLYVFHRTWWEFGVGLAGVLALRGLVTVWLVRLAWPADVPVVRLRRAFASVVVFDLVATVLLAPIVTLMFGIAVVPFSWPYLAAVPALVLLSLLLNHGGVVDWWWRALPTPGAAGWLLADFLALSAAGLALSSLPVPAGVAASAAAGAFQAWVWLGLTGSLAHRRWPRWPLPVAPVTAMALLLAAVVGARVAFAVAAGSPPVGSALPPPAAGAPHPVLVVTGFGTTCCDRVDAFAAAAPDLSVEQFSYLGLGPDGRPLPHAGAATNQPLALLADRLHRELTALADRTGRPVSLVAESEGTLVVYAYLARYDDPALDAVVTLSPIVEPGRVTYPAPGREGRGLVAGWQLRGLVRLIGDLSPFGVHSDRPLIASVTADGAAYAREAACRTDVRRLTVVPLADAVTLPSPRFPASVVVVPAFHGGLLGRADIGHRVEDFLLTGHTRPARTWTTLAELVSGAAAAWRVPSLPVTVRPCGGT